MVGKTRIGLLGALVLSLSVIACGGGDDSADKTGGGPISGERQKLIDSLSAQQKGSNEFSDSEIKCMVPGMVDAIGVDKLVKAGAADKKGANLQELGIDLSDKQAGDLFDAMSKCVDLRAAFAKGMAGSGISAAQGKCVSDAIDDATFRKLMVTALTEGDKGLSSDPSFTQAITQAATSCMAAGG
jgi:hypothetical protein